MRLGFLNSEISNIHAAALLLGAAGFLSRLLGVLRDRLLASTFGAGSELDAYYTAFQIPDFMSVLFILGAGSAAILPIFQEYYAKDKVEAENLISRLFTLFLFSSAIIAGIIFFFVPSFMRFIAPGFSDAELELASSLTQIMLLSPIFLGISGIFTSVVQSFQRFFAYALAPLLYNLGIIIGIIFFVPIAGLPGLAWGVVLGALLHVLVQIVSVANVGFMPRLLFRGHSEGIRKIVGLSFPRMLSVSLSQLTLIIIIAIGSTLAEGSVAVFKLAQNLYFLPIGIFGVSYAVAIFPRLSRAYIEKNPQDFFEELFWGMRSILFWIVPSVALFIVLRAHMVRAALGAGVFSWEDTRLTAAALAALSAALLAESLMPLFMKAYYSLENTWKPLWINMAISALSVGLAFALAYMLSFASPFADALKMIFRVSDLPHVEVVGLALGFSLGLLLNMFFLGWMLLRFARSTFRTDAVFPWLPVFKIVVAAAFGGIVAYVVRASFSETLPLITFFQVLWQGVVSGAVGFLVYFGILFWWGSEDARSLFVWFRQHLFSVGLLPKHWDGEMHPSQHP